MYTVVFVQSFLLKHLSMLQFAYSSCGVVKGLATEQVTEMITTHINLVNVQPMAARRKSSWAN